MRNVIYTSCVWLTALLLFSCRQADKPGIPSPGSESAGSTFENLSKTWVYVSDNMYVHDVMALKADSTFLYESGGCLGITYAAGKWTLQGNMIVLNSFDKYAPKTVTITSTPIDLQDESSVTSGTLSPIPGSETFTLSVDPSILSTSFTPCNASLPDSSFTYIKDRVLVFENDTLYELNGFMGSRSGAKYRAAKNQAL